jgi:hypothetical protein
LIGSEDSIVGNSQSIILKESENIKVTSKILPSGFQIIFENKNYIQSNNTLRYWFVTFCAPAGMKLQPGIYRKAQRFPFNEIDSAALSVSGDEGCNRGVCGEFEILEIVYDENDKIISFAANFTQRCEANLPPLFGSVRYKSKISLTTRFIEIFANEKENAFYLQSRNGISSEQMGIVYLTGEQAKINVNQLPYGGDGVEISIDAGKKGIWVFDFAAPLEDALTKGVYSNAVRYPDNDYLTPGIDFIPPSGNSQISEGFFKIIKYKKNPCGSLLELAITFVIKNENNEFIDGAIHFIGKADEEEPYAREETFPENPYD